MDQGRDPGSEAPPQQEASVTQEGEKGHFLLGSPNRKPWSSHSLDAPPALPPPGLAAPWEGAVLKAQTQGPGVGELGSQGAHSPCG